MCVYTNYFRWIDEKSLFIQFTCNIYLKISHFQETGIKPKPKSFFFQREQLHLKWVLKLRAACCHWDDGSTTWNKKLSFWKVTASLNFRHLYICEIMPLLIPCKVSACIGWLYPTVYSYFLLMSFPPAGSDLWPVIYLPSLPRFSPPRWPLSRGTSPSLSLYDSSAYRKVTI